MRVNVSAETVKIVLASLERRLERSLRTRRRTLMSLCRMNGLLQRASPDFDSVTTGVEKGLADLVEWLETDRQRRKHVLEDLVRIRATLEAKDLAAAEGQVESLIAFVEKVDPAVGL